ncbi:hypothetical protein [Streptomyces sp. NPDC004230]
MSTLAFLNHLVGAQVLGDHLTAAVTDLIEKEGVDRNTAYQWVTDQVDQGEPALLAAAGQTWVRRGDVDPEEAPVRTLYVIERTETGVFLMYYIGDTDTDCDSAGDGYRSGLRERDKHLNDYQLARDVAVSETLPRGAEFSVEMLHLYKLQAWFPAEFLLPTVRSSES